MKLAAQRREITSLELSPQTVVLRRTHQQRSNIPFHFDEVMINIIQQLHLLLRRCPFAGNIIKENGKGPYPQTIHAFELFHQQITVFRIPANVLSRMDSPIEKHFVPPRTFHQFFQLFGFLSRIGLAPVGRTVVRVVLRTVNIDIHLVAAIEIKLRQACFPAPGNAIETFHHTTVGYVGIIRHLHQRQFGQCNQLDQRLHTVKNPSTVGTGNNNTFLVYLQIITLCLFRDTCSILPHRLIPLHTDTNGKIGSHRSIRKKTGQQLLRRTSPQSGSYLQTISCRDKNRILTSHIFLRSGLEVKTLRIGFRP